MAEITMRRLTVIAALTALTAMTTTITAQDKNMTLANRQRTLVTIAANEAKGNLEGLKVSLNEGLEQGLTVSEAKEALSQLYAYTGFPRSLNALGILQQVIRERKEAGLVVEEGRHVEGESAKEGNKEIMIIPGASHVDLYDDVDGVIPYDKIESFFNDNLK